jgi:hypothetical protein
VFETISLPRYSYWPVAGARALGFSVGSQSTGETKGPFSAPQMSLVLYWNTVPAKPTKNYKTFRLKKALHGTYWRSLLISHNGTVADVQNCNFE